MGLSQVGNVGIDFFIQEKRCSTMGFQRFVSGKLVGFGAYGTAWSKTIPLFRFILDFQNNGDGIIYQYGKVGKDLFS